MPYHLLLVFTTNNKPKKMKHLKFISTILFLCMGITSFAQWTTKHNMSPAEYQAYFTESTGKGMRPVCISGYTVNGSEKYAALFEKKAGPAWIAKHGMSGADYQKNVTDFAKQGYVVSYISGYEVSGNVKYAALWEKKNTNYIARHGQTQAQFQAEFDADTKAGYRLIFVTPYTAGNTAYYASIFEKSAGPAYMAYCNMDAADYQQKFNTLTGQGYSVKIVNGCNVGGKDMYTAIWEKTNGPEWYAKHGIKGNNYQNNFDNFYYQGYKPAFISAFASSGTERFNGIWENSNISASNLNKINTAVNKYMSDQGVKALSIAVCKDDRLVYAKGFGDANPSTGQDMSPNYSMRIMSISKPITSTGIMKLVSQNKLNLDKQVFGPGSVFGSDYAYPASNKSNLEMVTVRMLLHHTSGMRSCNGEAPFWNASSSYADCMNVLLNSADLFKYSPNTKDNYSNANFFILARIIEKVSGQSYETYLRNNVLTPSGIGNTMYVGSTSGTPGSLEPSGYTPMNNMNLKMWDGFGGWVARPIDLLKVMVKFDGLNAKPDLISNALQDTMTTTTAISNGYALGWIANNSSQAHNGCFGGTRSFLWYDIPSGLSFAVIINNDPANDGCGWAMKDAMLNAVKSVSAWPGYDLF
jgi:CubicO group peptidase (beta-lactamase class C family)